MFERFTEEAREVVVRAQIEAAKLAHPYIGTEHLLLGVLAGRSASLAHPLTLELGRLEVVRIVGRGDAHLGLDPEGLATLGIDLDQVRRQVEAGALRPLPLELWEPVLLGPCQELSRLWLAGHVRTPLKAAERELAETTWRAVKGDRT